MIVEQLGIILVTDELALILGTSKQRSLKGLQQKDK